MADAQITFTIPEQYIPRIQNAFEGMADKSITISASSAPINPDGPCQYRSTYEYEFITAKSSVLSLIRAFVLAYEYGEDLKRYRNDVESIPEAAAEVPEEIIG